MNRFSRYFYDLIILVLIFHISQASVLNSRYVLFGIGIILLIIYLFGKNHYNRKFIILTLIWMAINLVAGLLLRGSFPLIRIIINTVILLFVPYILLNIMGRHFWHRFEKMVFGLTLIAIPLYLLNILFSEAFNSLWAIFRPLTSESFGKVYPYWTSLFYVNAIGDASVTIPRNCGFMWEPGGFAMIAIWGMVHHLRNNGNKMDKKVVVYLLAIVTTFSTAGYLAIILVVASIYLRRLTVPNILMIGFILTFYFVYVYNLSFISDKINTYITDYREDELVYNEESGLIKVNRLRGAYYAFQDALKLPTGFGVISKADVDENVVIIYGTSGLGSLLAMWGFPMFIYLLYLLGRYIRIIGLQKISLLNFYLLYFALLIVFFSNPISRNVFVYFIFLTPIAFEKARTYAYPRKIAPSPEPAGTSTESQ
jgi:hypothetical protein